MFDEIEEFNGNEIEFLTSMQAEIEEIGDPDMLKEFVELQKEALDMTNI